MRKKILMKLGFALLTLIFVACGNIKINGLTIGYKNLTDTEKEKIFMSPPNDKTSSIDSSYKYYAITGLQFKSKLADEDSSLVYFWSPHCKSKSCVLIKNLQMKKVSAFMLLQITMILNNWKTKIILIYQCIFQTTNIINRGLQINAIRNFKEI